jgi:hypothetical protein
LLVEQLAQIDNDRKSEFDEKFRLFDFTKGQCAADLVRMRTTHAKLRRAANARKVAAHPWFSSLVKHIAKGKVLIA